MTELDKFCEERYRESISNTISQIIDYCRHIQEEYILRDGEISGVELLDEIQIGQSIDMDTYIKMRGAIENYNTHYEINLIYKNNNCN